MKKLHPFLAKQLIKVSAVLFLGLMMLHESLFAQVPRNVPPPGDTRSIDMSNPWEVVAFIVVPILLIGYLFYTMLRKKKKDEDEAE